MDREDVLAVEGAAGPDADLAADATVAVEAHALVAQVPDPNREAVMEVAVLHAEEVGGGLELAAAALLAARAVVVALDEQHLDHGAPHGEQALGIALDLLALQGGLGAG